MPGETELVTALSSSELFTRTHNRDQPKRSLGDLAKAAIVIRSIPKTTTGTPGNGTISSCIGKQ